jgi:hypothetical protein
MSHSAAKFGLVTASVLSLSCLASSVSYAADMVEGYNPPPRHVIVVHHERYRPVRATYVRSVYRDCGQLIYEYRSAPAYTEVKTVCSPPWTKPSTLDY